MPFPNPLAQQLRQHYATLMRHRSQWWRWAALCGAAIACGFLLALKEPLTVAGAVMSRILQQPVTLDPQRGTICDVAFADEGRVLVSADVTSNGGAVRLWDVRTRRVKCLLSGLKTLQTIAVTPDGNTIATVDAGGLRLWHPATGHLMRVLSRMGSESQVAFSPNGKLVTCLYRNQTVRLWNLADGKLLWTLPRQGNYPWESALAFAPDGKTLACGGAVRQITKDKTKGPQIVGGSVQLVAVATGQVTRTLWGEWATAIAFSSDGATLATVNRTGVIPGGFNGGAEVWLFDAKTGKMQWMVAYQQDGPFYGVAFSPAGNLLATECGDHRVRLFNAHTGVLTRTLRSFHSNGLVTRNSNDPLAFAPDGTLLASRGEHEVRLWQMDKL